MRRVSFERDINDIFFMYYGVSPGYKSFLKTTTTAKVKHYLKIKHHLGSGDLFISLNDYSTYHTRTDVLWMIEGIRAGTKTLKEWEDYIFHKDCRFKLELVPEPHPVNGRSIMEVYVNDCGRMSLLKEFIMK